MLFYKCEKCGNFVTFLGKKSGCTPFCCGEEMKAVEPNTTDAAQEKHVPDVAVDGNKVTVKVGSVAHPMMEKHYIEYIILETSQGCHMKNLAPDMTPEAEFFLAEGETPVAAYENCNLHGFWKKEI